MCVLVAALCYETAARANLARGKTIRFSAIFMPWHPSSSEISGLYERHARAWDSDRSKSLFERAWLDRFKAAIPPGESILDLGCGSGEPMARYLIDSGYRVTGVDSSQALIGLCEARFPDETWIVGDMREVRLDRRFGGILAWDSFFHLTPDNQQRMFAIFGAHALPGAALMFTSGPRAGEAIGSYRGETLYHASLDPAEYDELLSAHGFSVLSYVPEDPHCGGHTVWLTQRR